MLVSPTSLEQPLGKPGGFIQRWKTALSAGASQVRAATLLPVGYPESDSMTHVHRIPLFVHPAFSTIAVETAADTGLTDDFILYHGPSDEASLHRLMSVWSWAASSLGDSHILVILNMDEAGVNWLGGFSRDAGMDRTIQYYTANTIDEIAAVYKLAYLLLHPVAGIPWSDPLHHAMAAGLPVVGIEHPGVDSVVGGAAYLAPEDNTRALGAALLASIVDESVYGSLLEAAGEQAKKMALADVRSAILRVYQSILGS